VFDATDPFINVLSIACPLLGAVLVVIFREPLVEWLQGIVPQKDTTKVRAAVFVGAFAIAAFIAGWILALLVPGSPPTLWLSIIGAAALAWIVVWALLANES
jgi:hypothetical protein